MAAAPTYHPDALPEHVAIIMDGNGRWAQAKHRPRVFGHREGVKTVRRVVEDASEIGLKCLTLYSFSTENWSRPKTEVDALFTLLRQYVKDDLATLHSRGVRIRILGSRQGLTKELLNTIHEVEHTTRENTNFALNIAFNYGGRDEIVRAARRAAVAGEDMSSITEAQLARYMDTIGLPQVDLVIRTSGEKRVSNFLIWQAAYAEFVFTDVLWPDFRRKDLLEAIGEFEGRNRRFGNVGGAGLSSSVA
jgi:undecaprenyl diphosphate synthase